VGRGGGAGGCVAAAQGHTPSQRLGDPPNGGQSHWQSPSAAEEEEGGGRGEGRVKIQKMQTSIFLDTGYDLVSRGQTLFRTEGKGLGHGHEQLVAQEFNYSCKSSHDVTMAIAKVKLATFLHP